MRVLALLSLLATPVLADRIEAPGPVTAVTLNPSGATVTRTVTFTAPAGTHEIVVPDLPFTMRAEGLRIMAPEGVAVGAVGLTDTAPLAKGGFRSAAVLAAEAEVARLDAVLRERRREVAGIRAHAEAAEARVGFLRSLAKTKGEGSLNAAGIPDLQALAAMIDQEVLAARQTVLAVEEQATAAEIALQPDVEALDRAKGVLAGLVEQPEATTKVLTVKVQTAAGGPATMVVESQIVPGWDRADWTPTYDMYLTRKPDTLRIARGALARQETGEDWKDIELTLSSASPDAQSQPSYVEADREYIKSEEELEREAKAEAARLAAGGEPVMEPNVAMKISGGLSYDTMGETFTYKFSAPVTIRSGADALRLAMDEVAPEVKVLAAASPYRDDFAFQIAEMTNTTGQPLLPGFAFLYAEGALVAMTESYEFPTGGEVLPPGGHLEIGFGPIHGLRVSRIEPERSEGAEGLIISSNRQEKTAIITVENLTGEAWPVRVTDSVPYSNQDDLTVSYTATPPATEENPEGRRGILVWNFDLAPGARQEIRLESRMDWPDGWVLQ